MTLIMVDGGQGYRVRSRISHTHFLSPAPIIFFRTMDSTDLFSFLEQAPDELEKDLDEVEMADIPTRKRKASPSVEQLVQNGESSHSGENGAGLSSHKKQRFASPAPIVLDEVEVEAKREVKASAGLMSAETDETSPRLELKHQARHLVSISHSDTNWHAHRLDIRLQYLQVIHTFQFPNTSHQRNRRESTNSSLTPSSNSQ